jgi:hypothetical protein
MFLIFLISHVPHRTLETFKNITVIHMLTNGHIQIEMFNTLT